VYNIPRGYDKIYREGKKVLLNLIDIPMPVIAALNGPTTVHSEYVLLASCARLLALPRWLDTAAFAGRPVRRTITR
jgi:hypothetical protein